MDDDSEHAAVRWNRRRNGRVAVVAALVIAAIAAAIVVRRGDDRPRRLSSAESTTPAVSPPPASSAPSANEDLPASIVASTTTVAETATTVRSAARDELVLDDVGVREYLGAGPDAGAVQVSLADAGSAVATLTVDRQATIIFGRIDSVPLPTAVDPGTTSTMATLTSTTLPTGVTRGPVMRVDDVVGVALGEFQSVLFSNDEYACAVDGLPQARIVALATTRDVHVALHPDTVARAWIIDAAGHHEVDASTVTCDSDHFEPAWLNVDKVCDEDRGCTSFAPGRDGRVVALDPVAGTLIVTGYAPDEKQMVEVPGLAGTSANLIAIGPDDIAYVTRQTPGQTDPIGDLLAISMAPGNAGAILTSVDQAIDYSGDSSLVRTTAGFVSVGCCGPDPVRPGTGDALVMGWVDSSGAAAVDDGPQMSVELRDDGSLDVVRRDGAAELRWNVADVGLVRGMPAVVATDDGGAMMLVYDMGSTAARIVAMFSDGAVYVRPLGHGTDSAPIFALLPDREVVACDGAVCYQYAPFG